MRAMGSSAEDNCGRNATKPWAIPANGWIAVLRRTWAEAIEDNIGLIAAGVAFYAMLAIAPLLAATVLLYGLITEPSALGAHLRAMLSIMPGDAVRLVGDLLQAAVHTSEGKKGFGLLVALAVAIYGGMNSANAIVVALNISYEEQETRSFVRLTLLALAMTIAGILTLIVAALAAAVIAHVRALLPEAAPPLILVGKALSMIFATAISAGIAATLYRYAPNRRATKWIWLSPGSILSAILWILISLAFGAYVKTLGNYDATYGSAGAVIVMLTWLYLSAYLLILGAELNSEVERQTGIDSAKGPDRPPGERGAVAPNTLAGIS